MAFWRNFLSSASRDEFDVVGIGNAIVDVVSFVDDAKISELRLEKGVMTLVDDHRSQEIYESIGTAMEISGGSAANTVVGVASLGGTAAYIGKIREDAFGKIFSHDIRAAGVHYVTAPASTGKPTACSIILVTQDAHRTMATNLGISVEFSREDLSQKLIAQGKVTYLEGYLFDHPSAKAAFITAAEMAHKAGRKVALTLSDPFCVNRHKAEFQNLVRHHTDILFANEAEVLALTETRQFSDAVAALRGMCDYVAITRSEKGSVILHQDQTIDIAAVKLDKVIDTTGAGDLYAAGVLFGLTHGRTIAEMGHLGSIAAGHIITQAGARPARKLSEIANLQAP